MVKYKIFGNSTKTNLEISWDWSRWLIGFGWLKHYYKYKYMQRISIHVNFGPLAFILTIL